jgi:putative nucleotidyltransferase with HDIG domain
MGQEIKIDINKDEILIEIHTETLLPGMILEADAFTADHVKKISKDEPLTEELINQLKSEKIDLLFYSPPSNEIKESYKLIELETKDLYPGIALKGDAFTPDGKKIISRGEIITADIIKNLEDQGIKKFNYNKPVYSSNFFRLDKFIVSNQLIEKSLYLAKEIENCVMQKTPLPKKDIENIIEQLIGEISISETYTILNMLKLKDFDKYTYTHSINVAMIAILFGKELLYNSNKLKILGMGAILHDLGKILIPKEILNKKGPLDQNEWEIMKKHTLLGYEIIQNQKNFEDEVENSLLSHHENYDGNGYPMQISRDRISEFCQIITLADTFDALTSETPYHLAYPISNSFLAIQNLSGIKFNPRFATEFINYMPRRLYGKPLIPLNTYVMLNTKEVAQVIQIDPSKTLRPVIMIYINSKMETLKYPIQVDLQMDKSRNIEKIIEDPKLLQALENMKVK